jgi:hypothetical protein
MSPAPACTARAVVALAALALWPAAATASVRYATPSGGLAAGGCDAAAPCTIEAAVGRSAAGDEVVLAPGTYALGGPLEAPAALDLHGAAGRPRPWLVGAGGEDDAVLAFRRGGSLHHLGIRATGPEQDALRLQGGVGDDLLLASAAGDGATVQATAAGTVLRDSVAYAGSSGHDAAGLRLRDGGGGDVHVVNVTVIAPAATGIACETKKGRSTIANAIVRGGTADVDAGKAPLRCLASTSDLRAAHSPGVVLSDHQEGDPRFADAAAGDFRVAGGSPAIDAGAADPLLGAADPAGCPRTLGPAPDMGAYEHADTLADACAGAPAEPLLGTAPPAAAPSAGGDTTADDTPAADIQAVIRGVAAPVVGRAVVVAPSRGTVRVRRPGSKRFRALDDAAPVPVGSVLDTRAGRVELVSAVDAAGRLQLGTFWGAKFQVRQARRGRGTVELRLRGGDFAACRTTATRGLATIARKRRAPVRSLWATDRHGRYRTHGQSSAATARGTAWLTRDRCDGTLTRVTTGSVSVRDHVRHRSVVVAAGHAYLARARR